MDVTVGGTPFEPLGEDSGKGIGEGCGNHSQLRPKRTTQASQDTGSDHDDKSEYAEKNAAQFVDGDLFVHRKYGCDHNRPDRCGCIEDRLDAGAEDCLANEEQREGDDVHQQPQPRELECILPVIPEPDAAAEQVKLQGQRSYRYTKQNQCQRRYNLNRNTCKEEGSTPDCTEQKQLQPGKTGHCEGIRCRRLSSRHRSQSFKKNAAE